MAKTTYCSFCGKGSDEAGPMMESQDRAAGRHLVRICRECARLAIEILDKEAERRGESQLND
jgi:ClpX C4-type zinc finger